MYLVVKRVGEGEGCRVKRVTGCERINTVVILNIINIAHHITVT